MHGHLNVKIGLMHLMPRPPCTRKVTLMPTDYEAGLEPVWTFWREQKRDSILGPSSP